MKIYFKLFLSIFYKFKAILSILNSSNRLHLPSIFYVSKIIIKGNDNSSLFFSVIGNSFFFINGNSNKVLSNSIEIKNSSISITGNNNEIIFEKDSKIRNCEIIIRGNGCKIFIGKKTTFGGARIINVGADNLIKIGNNCLFADNIEIWSSDTHAIFDSNHMMINQERAIIINDNVWIGAHVKILKGVTIGKGSVIGLGALVTNNVPSCSISVGNPNRVIREGISWKIDYPIN